MSDPKPSFYGIIPATVRYCPDITAAAKILYSELTALSEQEGYAWASNAYFAKLYGVNPTTVSEWVASLVRAGFIRICVDVKKGNLRKIWIVTIPKKPKRSSGKAEEGSSGKAEDINTRDNGKKETDTLLLLNAEETEKEESILTEIKSWFGHRPSTELDKAQKVAWRATKGIVKETTQTDLKLLKRFYAAPQAETFKRTSMATLLNNWHGEVAKAKSWAAGPMLKPGEKKEPARPSWDEGRAEQERRHALRREERKSV